MNALEEEINRYIGFPQEVDEDVSTTMIRNAARHFANWQKEQMLKDAMPCKLGWYDGFVPDFTEEQMDDVAEKLKLNVGDDIKVLIIKSE